MGDSMEISIHALREEGDVTRRVPLTLTLYFYPRPPRGGRLDRENDLLQGMIDFYPRPPRGGRLNAVQLILESRSISIHALREEGDQGRERP